MSTPHARNDAGLNRILDTVQNTVRSSESGHRKKTSKRSRREESTVSPADLREALSAVSRKKAGSDRNQEKTRIDAKAPDSGAQSTTEGFTPDSFSSIGTNNQPSGFNLESESGHSETPAGTSEPASSEPDSPEKAGAGTDPSAPSAETVAEELVSELDARQKAEQEELDRQKAKWESEPVDQSPVTDRAVERDTRTDPAVPQATPVTGHFNIICLTAMGYNRLIDLLLKEANYYDKMGEAGQEFVQIMENMVYTFSQSSSRFTDLQGNPEVLLTIMDEDFTNVLGILLKAAYTGHPDPSVDYSASLPYAAT